MRTLVTGAAGFIGHWLVRYLKEQGHWVRGNDCCAHDGWDFGQTDSWDWFDLRDYTSDSIDFVLSQIEWVFALAANMGGIGYITSPSWQREIMAENAIINLTTLTGVSDYIMYIVDVLQSCSSIRLLFTSSVCVYPTHLLTSLCPNLLTEDQAIPANPQDSYGWEKLFSEQLYIHYRSYGLETRIVRLENTYGPECQWRGGREKAPAALCRKVAMAKLKGEDSFEIWGDGEQRRTFMYIDDCVRGLVTVMESDEERPVNLGPDESISIDRLADLIMEAAGVDLKKIHVEGPQGVRGRNFSHERAKALGWKAEVPLKEGIAKTYEWIEGEVCKTLQRDTETH